MEEIEASRSCPLEPGSPPWLVFHHGENRSQIIFSLTEGRVSARSVPELKGSRYWPTPQGWLLVLDTPLHRYFLFDLATREKIALPPLKRKLPEDTRCLLSSSPTSPKCILMCADFEHRQLFYCNPRSDKWVRHRYKSEDWGATEGNLVDITTCNGKFYADTTYCVVVLIDTTNRPPQIRIVGKPDHYKLPIGVPSCGPCFTESCGELFCVAPCYGGYYADKIVHVFVSKLDRSKQKWDMVDSIGGRVFFFVDNHFGALYSASKIGVKGDCIYLAKKNDEVLYVFDMEEGTIQVQEPCSSLGKKWSAQCWIMPTI